MKFSQLLLLGLLAMWTFVASAAAEIPAAKAPTRCGNIDVPYPFGLDPQCAIHGDFVLNCSTVGRDTKLFLYNMEVIKVSVPDGKVWVKTLIACQCYNQTTNSLSIFNVWMSLPSTYALSADDNKVIVIGWPSSGPALDKQNAPKNGSCSGAGCCQADLPKAFNFSTTYLTSTVFYDMTTHGNRLCWNGG
nr:unnamed protein product [Digitaria exilis]